MRTTALLLALVLRYALFIENPNIRAKKNGNDLTTTAIAMNNHFA